MARVRMLGGWRAGPFGRLLLACSLALGLGAALAAPPTGSTGWNNSLAVDENGLLYGWGKQVAPGSSVPLPVRLPVPVAKVFGGAAQAYAIDTQGALWAWGDNNLGQLGDGTVVPKALPVKVGSGFSSLSANVNHTLGVKSDGSLWAWGAGLYGMLGDGDTLTRLSPVFIGNGVSAVSAGLYHSLAVRTDGEVVTWGRNQEGQLGFGFTSNAEPAPTLIGLSGARAVAAGYLHSLALLSDGSVWAWGDNTFAQLGDTTQTSTSTPRKIGVGFIAIAANGYQSMGLTFDGTLWVWGQYYIGNGQARFLTTPTPLATGVSSLSAGFQHGLLLRPGGQLSSWGDNRFGQLGNGSTTDRLEPAAVSSGWATVAAGSTFNIGIKLDGSLWTWGDDFDGQLGNGPPENKTTASAVGSGYRTVAAGRDHSLALKTDGTLWSWGKGNAHLGLGIVGHQSQPRQVGSGYATMAAGADHSMALKADGTLWTWGVGPDGQLGTNTNTEWTPKQVGTARYASVAAGGSHSLALQADGSLWGWGANEFGQLGVGDRSARSVPTRVGGGFHSVMAGGRFTLAFKTDGSLWGWGSNGAGQLGLGHSNDMLSPTLLGTGYTKAVAGQLHVAALRGDGSLWVWGENLYHQLGDGTRDSRYSPVRLGDGFVDVFANAASHHTMGLRRDGTVWIWGLNNTGQLGDGSIATIARPLTVVNQNATGPLRLSNVGGAGSAEQLAFLLRLQNQGYDLKASLSDLRAAGLQGEVYFSVLLPRSSVLAGCVSNCGAAAAPPARSPQRGPLSAFRSTRPLADAPASAQVAGVLVRGGFKQTGGTGTAQPTQAASSYTGNLGQASALEVFSGVGNPLAGSNAVICMGVTVPELSAKGQVLQRPIATGSAVQGVVQCPPVQTAATLARFRAQSSGPITARTIVAEVTPLPEERGRQRQVFSWAVAPDGRQYMQTAPNVWEAMAEPMRPVATVTLPSTGTYRLEVTRGLNLSGLEGTLVFIGVGNSWPEVRDLNQAGQHTTVQ